MCDIQLLYTMPSKLTTLTMNIRISPLCVIMYMSYKVLKLVYFFCISKHFNNQETSILLCLNQDSSKCYKINIVFIVDF